MSRFADPRTSRTIDLGPCDCPGTPHQRDFATVRGELSVAARTRIGEAADRSATEATFQVVKEGIVSWNLLGADGNPMPATGAAIEAITDPDLIVALVQAIVVNYVAAQAPAKSSGRHAHNIGTN